MDIINPKAVRLHLAQEAAGHLDARLAEADAPADAFFEAEDTQSGRRRYLSISDVQASDGLQRSITDVRAPRWWDLYASTHIRRYEITHQTDRWPSEISLSAAVVIPVGNSRAISLPYEPTTIELAGLAHAADRAKLTRSARLSRALLGFFRQQ